MAFRSRVRKLVGAEGDRERSETKGLRLETMWFCPTSAVWFRHQKRNDIAIRTASAFPHTRVASGNVCFPTVIWKCALCEHNVDCFRVRVDSLRVLSLGSETAFFPSDSFRPHDCNRRDRLRFQNRNGWRSFRVENAETRKRQTIARADHDHVGNRRRDRSGEISVGNAAQKPTHPPLLSLRLDIPHNGNRFASLI